MDSATDEYIKHRELCFSGPHEDPAQAQTAMLLLSDIRGVERLHLQNPQRLQISYDIRHLSLQMIEEALRVAGFHMDNGLLSKLRRALYYYTESVQRENLGCRDDNTIQNIFINRYQRLPHGCRDERPGYWRKYL